MCNSTPNSKLSTVFKPLRFLRKHLPYPRYRATEEDKLRIFTFNIALLQNLQKTHFIRTRAGVNIASFQPLTHTLTHKIRNRKIAIPNHQLLLQMSSPVSPCQWRYRGSGELASRRGCPTAAKRLCSVESPTDWEYAIMPRCSVFYAKEIAKCRQKPIISTQNVIFPN